MTLLEAMRPRCWRWELIHKIYKPARLAITDMNWRSLLCTHPRYSGFVPSPLLDKDKWLAQDDLSEDQTDSTPTLHRKALDIILGTVLCLLLVYISRY